LDGREGVVSLRLASKGSAELVDFLAERGIRVHIRKNDHYCGNILGPLGVEDCIRVSISHYNSHAEVAQFLSAMAEATGS
jgi:selenocysteine lyase/cysteine desulfurase